MGIGAVQNGLRVVSLGKKALAVRRRWQGGKRKDAQKAMQKAERQAVQASAKKRRQRAMRRIKGIGRVAWVLWKKYF